MLKKCEEKKRDDEALKLCLPRRVPSVAPPAHRQSFTQALAWPPRTPRLPKLQAAPQALPRASAPNGPWKKKSFPQEGTRSDQPPPPNLMWQGGRSGWFDSTLYAVSEAALPTKRFMELNSVRCKDNWMFNPAQHPVKRSRDNVQQVETLSGPKACLKNTSHTKLKF